MLDREMRDNLREGEDDIEVAGGADWHGDDEIEYLNLLED